jgi:hypothetical protein
MHFNRILLLAAASFALAAPEPKPNPVAMPAPESTGLLSELPGILSGAEDLLSQDNVNNLQIIIGNAAKLLSDDNLVILQDILTNAHSLLTKDFVDNTTTLIGDATPVCIPLRVDRDTGLTTRFSSWRTYRSCWAECWGPCKGTRVHDFHCFNDGIRDQSRDYYTIFRTSGHRASLHGMGIYTDARKKRKKGTTNRLDI